MPTKAIRAKLPLSKDVTPKVTALVRKAGGDLVRVMAHYPPQMPTVSGYVRTGHLGRYWTMHFKTTASYIAADVNNNVVYRPFVQGPKQTGEMKRRHWPELDASAAPIRKQLAKDVREAIKGSRNR